MPGVRGDVVIKISIMLGNNILIRFVQKKRMKV